MKHWQSIEPARQGQWLSITQGGLCQGEISHDCGVLERYHALPEDVQHRADRAYELWQVNPQAQGLYFKRVGTQRPIHSVRIDREYRALGILDREAILWFWIGLHDEYMRMLKHL